MLNVRVLLLSNLFADLSKRSASSSSPSAFNPLLTSALLRLCTVQGGCCCSSSSGLLLLLLCAVQQMTCVRV